MQTRIFDGVDFGSVFQAFKTVLQKQGYLIKREDATGGLLVASIQRSSAKNRGGRGSAARKGYEVCVSLEQPFPRSVEARTSIQKMEQHSWGEEQGEEVLDEPLYRQLYDRVSAQLGQSALRKSSRN